MVKFKLPSGVHRQKESHILDVTFVLLTIKHACAFLLVQYPLFLEISAICVFLYTSVCSAAGSSSSVVAVFWIRLPPCAWIEVICFLTKN